MPAPTPPSRPARSPRAILLFLICLLAASLLPAQAAHAAGYSFWGYAQFVNGAWTYATTGAATTTPADGAVEGWRWSVSEENAATPRVPRLTPVFADICGTAPAAAGKKRVAVVIDFGRDVDGDGTTKPPSPVQKCAVVPAAATGAEVLAAVATVRTDKAFTCAIDDYLPTGCGAAVATLTDAQKAPDEPLTALGATGPSASETAGTQGVTPISADADSSSGIPVGVWVGLLVIVVGILAIIWTAQRRRKTST